MLLLVIGNGYSSRMQIGICYYNHSYTETLHTDIKRMLKRYKGQYTVMKRILIDIQRSYADLISYVYTMYPYPELSGVCIPVVPKTAYATIADQFCVISMQYTTPHTVCLRAVPAVRSAKSAAERTRYRRGHRTTTTTQRYVMACCINIKKLCM